ncbi:MAG: hypothetical protein M3457_08240, partial [Chloroflexota bacterium]|nr:hypothetical protein [Chloroflexota bacterium]
MSRSILTILSLVALMGMILSPIADDVALAQGGDAQVALEEAEEVEQAEDPVPPTEPVQPTEPPLVSPPITEVPLEGIEEPAPATEMLDDDSATEEPVEVQTHRLTITVYHCDHPTFDPYFSSNAQMVLDQCVGQGSGEFSIESTIPVQPQTGGALEFQIGDFLGIVERVAPGYDDPIANCFLRDANGATIDQIGPGKANGGFWKVGSVQSDVHCDWYQVDRGHGDVYIVNMACPQSLNLHLPNVPGSAVTMEELVEACTEPAGAITFTVTYSGISSVVDTTGGEFNDVFFGGVNSGPITIWEDTPPQFEQPIVFCQVNTTEGVELVPFAPAGVHDGRAIDWDLGHGQRLHCAWFNVPPGPGLALPDDPTPTQEPVLEQPPDPGFGAVAINVHACAEGIAAYSLDMYEMAAQCQADPGSVDFTVTNGAYNQTVAAAGGANYASFSDVPEGSVTVTGELPDTYGTPVVFCKVELELDLSDILPTQKIPVAAGAFVTMPLGDGHLLWCDWYNVPGSASPNGAPSDFTVALHTCPAGYDPEAVGANPNLDCPPGPNGVEFTLESEDAGTADRQAITGDSIDNRATFGTVLPGDYTVTQDVPDDIETSFVLGCGGGGGIGPIPAFVEDTVEIGIPPGIVQTCPWFNIPEGDGTRQIAAALTGTASLTMYAYTCPAGFDVNAVDANPQASCTLADGIRLEMDDSIDDNGGWEFETGSTGSGYSTIDGLAPDRYTITESVRNGTTATFAWDCYDLTGSSSRTDPMAMGNYLTYDLADGAQIRCDWFNVTGGTGRVIVNKHACDYLIPAYTLTYEQLVTQCTLDPGSIDFTVVSDTHQETQPASQTPLQLASFANVPSGYVAVVEKLPDGWGTPIVYCQVNLESGDPVSPPAQVEVYVGRQVNFPLEPGQVVYCDWYNVARGLVDVHVAKHACSQGFDAYAADLTELVVNCTADPGIIDFTVEDGALYLQTKTATAAATASFVDVPSGRLRISEELPAGYGLPVVYCRIDFEDGSNVAPAARMTIGGNSTITAPLSAGQVLNCDWYNVPGGAGSVSIWKQLCPEGFDAHTATRLELENLCGDDIPTIDFGLTSGSFSATASSTNLFRYADFPAVPAGSVTVTETVPDGYGEPVVYCHVQETGKPVQPDEKVTVAGGASITWELDADQRLICEWYNAYDSGSIVTVDKFDCPEGTAYDHDLNWYSQNCTAPHDGIEFNLTHSGGLDPEFTANGTVQWSGIPLGPVRIQEYIPGDYGEPAVFCGVVSSSGGPVDAVAKRVESPGGYVETRFDYPNTRYLCYWYNIPGDPGEVTVHKYTCPPGYDLHAEGADPKIDCPEVTNGVPFTLQGAGGDAQSTTGDASDGAVRFGDLGPGPYTVTETMPPGT